MSVSRLSDECAGGTYQFVFGTQEVEPEHEACSGGYTRPGILGGWVCSCPCHQAPRPVKVYATGMSNPHTVTVGVWSEDTLGLSIRAPYGTVSAWLTESEAQQVVDALTAALSKRR